MLSLALGFLDLRGKLSDPLAEGGLPGVPMISALVEVADPMDCGDIEGLTLAAEEPAEGPVLVGLAPVGGGLLVVGKVVAVSETAGGLAMGDLEGARGPGRVVRFEVHRGRGKNLGAVPPLLEGGSLWREKVGTPFDARKDKRFTGGLEGMGKAIETALAEEEIAVREPDPVGARFAGGEVASDGPAKEMFAGKGPPVPGDGREVLLSEEGEQRPCLLVLPGIKDGHRDIQIRR